MKTGLIIGTSKLYSIQEECFLVSCGGCGGLFHILKSDKKRIMKCPNCHQELEIENPREGGD
jgi:Zn finger protein HypA/HybF involved in hydrogenase expression